MMCLRLIGKILLFVFKVGIVCNMKEMLEQSNLKESEKFIIESIIEKLQNGQSSMDPDDQLFKDSFKLSSVKFREMQYKLELCKREKFSNLELLNSHCMKIVQNESENDFTNLATHVLDFREN